MSRRVLLVINTLWPKGLTHGSISNKKNKNASHSWRKTMQYFTEILCLLIRIDSVRTGKPVSVLNWTKVETWIERSMYGKATTKLWYCLPALESRKKQREKKVSARNSQTWESQASWSPDCLISWKRSWEMQSKPEQDLKTFGKARRVVSERSSGSVELLVLGVNRRNRMPWLSGVGGPREVQRWRMLLSHLLLG